MKLNATHCFIMKIPNRREVQQMESNHFSDIDFEDFMKRYKDYTKEPYSYLVNDMTLSSDNLLRWDLGRTYYKMRKSRQSIAKWSKTKLNII